MSFMIMNRQGSPILHFTYPNESRSTDKSRLSFMGYDMIEPVAAAKVSATAPKEGTWMSKEQQQKEQQLALWEKPVLSKVSPPPTKAPARVRFSEMVGGDIIERDAPSLGSTDDSSCTPSEGGGTASTESSVAPGDIWFTTSELLQFRQGAADVVARRPKKTIATLPAQKERENLIEETEEEKDSIRGLEHWQSAAYLRQMKALRKSVVRAVMEEQSRQRVVNVVRDDEVVDPSEAIREVSKTVSMLSRRRAVVRAQRDEREVMGEAPLCIVPESRLTTTTLPRGDQGDVRARLQ